MRQTTALIRAALALTLAACREDAESPTAPATRDLTPVAAATAVVFRQVSAGGSHGCGVTTEDRAFCWGLNNTGQLGIGHTTPSGIDAPVPVATVLRFRSVSAGGGFTCGVTRSDAIYCWGDNGDGQLGTGTPGSSSLPVRVATGIRMREVSTGTHHACAVSVGDIAYCWGRNDHGQVGDGTTTARAIPTRPQGWAHFRTVSAGDEFTCGVTATGSVAPPHRAYCWGATSDGRYGDQNTRARTVRPTGVPGKVDFDSVASGLTHVCGVTPNKAAYCWGADNWWLGSPSSGSDFQVTPRLVSGGHDFRSVQTGTYWSCGVTPRDAAFCWGVRTIGVGDGTPDGSPVPVRVGGTLRLTAVSTGGQFSCGLTSEGRLYCWGDFIYGPTPVLLAPTG